VAANAGLSGLAGSDGAAIDLDDESWVFADIKLSRTPRRLRLKAKAYRSRPHIVGDSCTVPGRAAVREATST